MPEPLTLRQRADSPVCPRTVRECGVNFEPRGETPRPGGRTAPVAVRWVEDEAAELVRQLAWGAE
jgi:hypothetical protein